MSTTAVNQPQTSDLEFVSVLRSEPERKLVFLLTRLKSDPNQQAVVILEKFAYDSSRWQDLLDGLRCESRVVHNATTREYAASVHPSALNLVKCVLMHPATADDVNRFTAAPTRVFRETAEVFQQVMLPHIASAPSERNTWIDNVLAGTSEAHARIFEDCDPETGFVLVPDIKWDRVNAGQLYCLVLVHKAGIHSLRALNSSHLPLLYNIRDRSLDAIYTRFGVDASSLRLFIHYIPSYFHLHIHVAHVDCPAKGMDIGKAHLLDDVITNIEAQSDYYQTRTLTCVVRENHPYYQEYLQYMATVKKDAV
jgi:m7GpppX diphosphatase